MSVCLLVPATIVNSSVVDLVEVIENHTVYLRCAAEGIPQPSIIWLRNDLPMILDDDEDQDHQLSGGGGGLMGKVREMSSGRQLEIRQVRVSDEAVFQCRATNVAGQQNKRFTLRVLGTLDHQSDYISRANFGEYGTSG